MTHLLRLRRGVVAAALLSACLAPLPAAAQAVVSPATGAGLDAARLEGIASLVEEGIRAKQLPGAVVVVGRGDQVFYQKAFGHRALDPSLEPMTLDTIFDLASLTKVVATTTSLMMLLEEGKVRLNDRVAAYIPGFERYGKGDITIRHLMTHVSGLRPDLDMTLEFESYDEAIARAIEEVPTSPPGERLVYSDINFFLLGEIVHRASGMTLDQFARTRIFEPLGHARHDVQPASVARAADRADRDDARRSAGRATRRARQPLRGVVHDPTARRMQGVAGPRGAVQHGRRPRHLLPHAARRRPLRSRRASCRR